MADGFLSDNAFPYRICSWDINISTSDLHLEIDICLQSTIVFQPHFDLGMPRTRRAHDFVLHLFAHFCVLTASQPIIYSNYIF